MGLSLAESRTVLGLSVDSTEEESKSAYKKAALKSHPDKNEHDSTVSNISCFLQERYKTLSTKERTEKKN